MHSYPWSNVIMLTSNKAHTCFVALLCVPHRGWSSGFWLETDLITMHFTRISILWFGGFFPLFESNGISTNQFTLIYLHLFNRWRIKVNQKLFNSRRDQLKDYMCSMIRWIRFNSFQHRCCSISYHLLIAFKPCC